jgi:hypothetical protein
MQITVELNIPDTPLFKGTGQVVVTQELMEAAEYSVNLAAATILPLTPIDRGILRSGMQTSVLGTALEVTGRVFNPVPYALSVETGTAPHFPPVDALEGWGRRKLGQEGLGFVLARAISKRGTKGVFMFKQGLDACRPRIEGRYAEALSKIVSRLGG